MFEVALSDVDTSCAMHLSFSVYHLPWHMSRMSVHLHVGCEKSQFLHFKSKTMSSFLVDSGDGHRYSNNESLRVSRASCLRC